MRRFWLGCGLVIIATVGLASFASRDSAAAASTANPCPVTTASGGTCALKDVCTVTGVTTAVMRRIFGAGASLLATDTYECEIESPQPGTSCKTPHQTLTDGRYVSTCSYVSVTLFPADDFQSAVKGELHDLGLSGHASEKSVSGAGTGAVLMLSTSYGDTQPEVVLEGGPFTIVVSSPDIGVRYNDQWETLARAIHAHLA